MTDNKIKTEQLDIEQVEKELTWRKGRTQNTLAIMAIVSVVVLILTTTVVGIFIAPEKMEVINLSFVAIGTYTGMIAKDITGAFWGTRETTEENK